MGCPYCIPKYQVWWSNIRMRLHLTKQVGLPLTPKLERMFEEKANG